MIIVERQITDVSSPVFSGILVSRSSVFCVMFCRSLFVLFLCIASRFLNYDFWLPLWSLQTFFKHSDNNWINKISEIRWIICGRVPSRVYIWLRPLWWIHCERFDYWRFGQRFNNWGYSTIMGNDWLLALRWPHGQRIDSWRYDGVIGRWLILALEWLRGQWFVY
jgi:hypothetical protein